MHGKLGLNLPVKKDIRTIPLRAILNLPQLPPLPETYSVHEKYPVNDSFAFNNTEYGDCVIAAQAHGTLVIEKFEQGVQIPITEKEVTDEYFRQTGGPDSGLWMLLSMKEWRKRGWDVGGKRYNIYAFATVDNLDLAQLKYGILLLNGVYLGLQMFQTDLDQFDRYEPWHLTPNNGAFRGGHALYSFRYHDGPGSTTWTENVACTTSSGLWVMTWGRPQFMTWEFYEARVNEAFAIVDNRNKWQPNSPVDVEALDEYLEVITGEPGTNGNDSGGCCVKKLIRRIRT